MNMTERMEYKRQRCAEMITAACNRAGLDGHIKWIRKKSDVHTWAERVAFLNPFGGMVGKRPVKNSHMYCDTLDMCFYYNHAGVATVSYAGRAELNRADMRDGKLIEAFQKAKVVLEYMQELMDAENWQEDQAE